jgi:NADH-quinone oxidoreductase subunit J/NAD(P)H-quinone oxidoreductase subunit 6
MVGSGVGLGLSALLVDAYRWSTVELPEPGGPAQLGTAIFQNWVLPFEVLSVLLLSALIGAIVISRPDVGARPPSGPEGER